MRRTFEISVLIFAAVIAGCGGAAKPAGTISGVVTFEGQPVKAGEVTLYSSALGSGASAAIGEEGRYEISTPLEAGEYQVAVLPPSPPPPQEEVPETPSITAEDIPAKYRDFQSSGLTLSVQPGDNEFNIGMTP